MKKKNKTLTSYLFHKKTWLIVFSLLVLLFVIASIYTVWSLKSKMSRFAKTGQNSTTLYGQYIPLKAGTPFYSKLALLAYLTHAGYEQVRQFSQDSSKQIKINFLESSLDLKHWDKNEKQIKKYTLFLSEASPGIEIKKIYDQSERKITLLKLPPRFLSFYSGKLHQRQYVPLHKIPTNIKLAIMSVEDKNFLDHQGVSLKAILRALWVDIKAGGFVQGGSTITQQLMKNLFFSHQKTILRKINEAFFAIYAEILFSKEQLLEAYLNEIYLGQRSSTEIHGVADAALYYFNKELKDVSLPEAATLAAMIHAPNFYQKKSRYQKLINRRNIILKKMVTDDLILTDDYEEATQSPNHLRKKSNRLDEMDYFLDYLVSQKKDEIEKQLKSSPSVITTLDPFLQSAGSWALNQHLDRLEKGYASLKKQKETSPLQGALVAINTKTCEIITLIGGRHFRTAPFNRATEGKRQVGSLAKPFVYLSAFIEGGFDPETMIEDKSFTWKYDKQEWSPQNYDKKFHGNVSIRRSLKKSYNIPAAKIAQSVGLKKIIKTIKKSGYENKIRRLPSISLGTFKSHPLQVAQLYTTLSKGGMSCKLKAIHTNEDPKSKQVWPEEKVEELNQILSEVFEDGTARGAKSILNTRGFMGKTGTTNDYRDAWFAGYSKGITTIVWVGYDDSLNVKLPGSVAALPIWAEFMKSAYMYR